MHIDKHAINKQQNGIRTRNPTLFIASWNVQTMCTGLSDDLQKIDDSHKATVSDHELNQTEY